MGSYDNVFKPACIEGLHVYCGGTTCRCACHKGDRRIHEPLTEHGLWLTRMDDVTAMLEAVIEKYVEVSKRPASRIQWPYKPTHREEITMADDALRVRDNVESVGSAIADASSNASEELRALSDALTQYETAQAAVDDARADVTAAREG